MSSLQKGQLKFLNLIPDHGEKRRFLKSFDLVLSSGDFILGKSVKKFEQEFSRYLGVKYCIGVGNGLEAIQIALMSLGIGKGDEVITTPISAAATTLAILITGAIPVFVDTTADGLINTNLISDVITKKTKAIIPVHLYGNPVALDRLQTICKKNNLFLIEDASQAHGSSFKGRKLGTFGDINCFSFYPTKNLGALGDGGAIVTDNAKLARICKIIRDYGQQNKYNHVGFGLNSRLDEIQAALLSVKLKHLERDNAKRRTLAKRYIKNLSEITDFQIIIPNKNAISNFHLFVIRTNKRRALQKFLQTKNIPTLIHYPKILTEQPFLKKYHLPHLILAKNFVKTCLSLPLHPKITLQEVNIISSEIREFFKK